MRTTIEITKIRGQLLIMVGSTQFPSIGERKRGG
jgi:hypothetical protein